MCVFVAGHAVVKWQPDPEDGPNTVRDWRKGQSQREAAAGAAAAAGEDSGTDEEFQDDDDVAPAAAKPRRAAFRQSRTVFGPSSGSGSHLTTACPAAKTRTRHL